MAKIAFLITAHQDPQNLMRLLQRLEPYPVLVHVDLKTNLNSDWDQVVRRGVMIKNRCPVYWCGFSTVRATIELMRALLNTGEPYSKIVLLTGACYPIRPLAQLADLFANDGGHNYINANRVADSDHLRTLIARRYFREGLIHHALTARYRPFHFAEKALRKSLETATRLLKIDEGQIVAKEPTICGLVPYHGSAYWALTRECVEYVVNFFDTRKDVSDYYYPTWAPEEQYFHTVVRVSPFAASVDAPLHFTGRGMYKTANLHLIHPLLSAKWYGAGDFEDVRMSGKYFVRKVRTDLSTPLLDRIDAELLGV